MSDNSFPFGSTPQPQAPELQTDTISATRDRKALVAVGGVVAAALVAGGAFFVLSSGGDDAVPAAAHSTATSVASPQVAGPGAEPTSVPAVYRNDIGRNPFKALVTPTTAPESASGGTSGPSGTGTGTSVGGPALPTSVPTLPTVTSPVGELPVLPGTGTAPAPTGGAPAPKPTPHSVSVLSVDPDNASASLEVDTKDYPDVKIDAVFATYFKLLRVEDGKCTSMSFGDERFDLCAGETTELQ